jgi:hypothetical protein
MNRLLRATLSFCCLFAGGSVAFAVDPAPTTKPTTLPALEPVPDDLTGEQLAVAAQKAFNRGEYAKALPLLLKLRGEADGQPAKMGAIQERIRVCEKALAALAGDPNAAESAILKVPQTAEQRKPHAPLQAGEVREVSIQSLGNFEYDQESGGNLPKDVLALSGGTIRVRGYMIPMDQADNITQFALVPSLFACCFGQPPQIQHTIVANCPKGKAVSYSPDELIVEGKLKVEEKKDEGYIISVFEMEVTSVRTAPK